MCVQRGAQLVQEHEKQICTIVLKEVWMKTAKLPSAEERYKITNFSVHDVTLSVRGGREIW